MKGVTVMSGPAVRKIKAENARLRDENRRLRRVMAWSESVVGAIDAQLQLDGNQASAICLPELRMAIASAKEVT